MAHTYTYPTVEHWSISSANLDRRDACLFPTRYIFPLRLLVHHLAYLGPDFAIILQMPRSFMRIPLPPKSDELSCCEAPSEGLHRFFKSELGLDLERDRGTDGCYENRAKSFVFSAAYLRTDSIFILRGAPTTHVVLSECMVRHRIASEKRMMTI